MQECSSASSSPTGEGQGLGQAFPIANEELAAGSWGTLTYRVIVRALQQAQLGISAAPCCRTHAAVPLLLLPGCHHSFVHTGVIPAVDTGSDIPAAAELGDLAAACAITAALAKAGVVNLDAWLSPAQKAEQLAFVTLVTTKLDVATHYTTWLEARGFREFRKVKQLKGFGWLCAGPMPVCH